MYFSLSLSYCCYSEQMSNERHKQDTGKSFILFPFEEKTVGLHLMFSWYQISPHCPDEGVLLIQKMEPPPKGGLHKISCKQN